MSDFKKKIAAPYQLQIKNQQQLIEKSEQLRQNAEAEVVAWPMLTEYVQNNTLPELKQRMGQLDENMQPLDLTPLKRANLRLKHLLRITWKIPRARRIRMLNMLYRSGIFTIRVIQLCLILAMFYGILRIVWWLV